MRAVELDMCARYAAGAFSVELVAKQRFASVWFDENMDQRLRDRQPPVVSIQYAFVIDGKS